MSQLSLMLRNHAVLVEPFGGSAVVNVDSAGGTVYYADTRSVSSSSNQGSIAPGGSQTFTSNAYITSAGVTTSVLVTTTSIYDEWVGVTPLNIGGGASVIDSVNTVAAAGAAQTIPDVTVAQSNRLTLTAASCALTFPTAAAGKSFLLALVQDGTGSRAATFPGTVKWAGGVAPALTTAATKVDLLSFVCLDGTNWLGSLAGANF